MSVQTMGWVLDHMPDVTPAARLVLISIANHAKADGTGAWPSFDTMARESRLTRRHVIRCIQELQVAGIVVVERHAGPAKVGGKPNLYAVIMESGDMLTPPNEGESGDISDPGGDIHANKVVTPRSPEPSTKPSLEPKPYAARKEAVAREAQYVMVQALSAALGSPPPDRGLGSEWYFAATVIVKAGGTPAEVPEKIRRYAVKFPGAAATPRALAKWWGTLTDPDDVEYFDLEKHLARLDEAAS